MEFNKKARKLADYAATFLVNFAVIGVGLGIFEDKNGTLILSFVALLVGAYITWRAA